MKKLDERMPSLKNSIFKNFLSLENYSVFPLTSEREYPSVPHRYSNVFQFHVDAWLELLPLGSQLDSWVKCWVKLNHLHMITEFWNSE